MAAELQGKRIAFLVAPEGVEQVELTEPWQAVKDAGGKPVLVSTDEGEIQAFNHLDKGDTFPVHAIFDGRVRGRVRRTGAAGRGGEPRFPADAGGGPGLGARRSSTPASPWPLSATLPGPSSRRRRRQGTVVAGRTLTSWPSLQTDLRNAGATWVDEEVVVDKGTAGSASVLITSRKPDDLKAFCTALVEQFAG